MTITVADGTVSSAVSFRDIGRAFARPSGGLVPVLEAVSLEVEAGSVTSLIGKSGCGKSTLLSMAAGLLSPTSGEVVVHGEHVKSASSARAAGIGFVMQTGTLLPWTTVLKNVTLPLKLAGVPRTERVGRAREWLERVGLKGYEDYYPSQLSGGMQKRADVARTFCYAPKVMMMDEPFGALDALTKLSLQDLLISLLAASPGMTVLFVTHDLTEAIAISDRVIVLGGQPSTVSAVIDVDLERPRDIYRIAEHRRFAALHARLREAI